MPDTWSRINFILVFSLEASSSVAQNKHTRHMTVSQLSGMQYGWKRYTTTFVLHAVTIRSLIRLKSKNTNLLLVHLSQSFVAFFQVVFVKNYSEPNVLYTLNLYSFLSVEEKVSHSYQTADKIMVCDFLIISPRTQISTDNIISWNLSIS